MITRITPTPGDPVVTETLCDTAALMKLVDVRQKPALNQWLDSTRDMPVPNRKTLRPDRIVAALPVSALIHVDWNGAQPGFRARIEGHHVRQAFGETRGKPFDEIHTPEHLQQVLAAFCHTARQGQVILSPVTAKTATGEAFGYTRLLLPYADDTGLVVRILAVYGFDLNRVNRLQRPLDIGDVHPTRIRRGPAHLCLLTG